MATKRTNYFRGCYERKCLDASKPKQSVFSQHIWIQNPTFTFSSGTGALQSNIFVWLVFFLSRQEISLAIGLENAKNILTVIKHQVFNFYLFKIHTLLFPMVLLMQVHICETPYKRNLMTLICSIPF